MTLYLVGGVARSGKSTLAERLRQRRGAAWFPLDALKMGLFLGAPNLGVHPEHGDLETADRMWPIVRGLIENILFDGRSYTRACCQETKSRRNCFNTSLDRWSSSRLCDRPRLPALKQGFSLAMCILVAMDTHHANEHRH